MIFLYFIILVMLTIYNITGIWYIIPLFLAFSNFVLATFNLIYDHKNKYLRLIQLISLAFMVFVIIINLKILIFGDNIYKLTFIIPLSINKISFFKERISNLDGIYVFSDYSFEILHFFDTTEISVFLEDTLEKDKVYIVSLELIKLYPEYSEGDPTIVLSAPILITSNSNPNLISNFIHDKIRWASLIYDLQDSTDNSNKVLLKYREINISNLFV